MGAKWNLPYFKRQSLEINQMNEIFIHDSYYVKFFKEFINSLERHKIEVNEHNYSQLSELSRKYEYEELEEKLATFSRTRPDLQIVLESTKTSKLDPAKEEKLSKNLDICLRNKNFINLPLPVLARILNSPNRILNDHHLLVEFIKKLNNKYRNCKKKQQRK